MVWKPTKMCTKLQKFLKIRLKWNIIYIGNMVNNVYILQIHFNFSSYTWEIGLKKLYEDKNKKYNS